MADKTYWQRARFCLRHNFRPGVIWSEWGEASIRAVEYIAAGAAAAGAIVAAVAFIVPVFVVVLPLVLVWSVAGALLHPYRWPARTDYFMERSKINSNGGDGNGKA